MNNLEKSVNEKVLEEKFSEFGPINKIEVVKDPFTNESRGFAFISFKDKDSVSKAIT